MGDALFRSGQPFSGTNAIGALPEDGQIAFAVGLKRYSLAVRGPDGITIRTADRELARSSRPANVVYPHVGVFALLTRKRNAFAIGGRSKKAIGSGRNVQRLNHSFAIHNRKHLLITGTGRGRTRNVDQ